MTDKPKICTDCRHHHRDDLGNHWCTEPSVVWINVVTGVVKGQLCVDMRDDSSSTRLCGPDGLRWEPKLAQVESYDEGREADKTMDALGRLRAILQDAPHEGRRTRLPCSSIANDVTCDCWKSGALDIINQELDK